MQFFSVSRSPHRQTLPADKVDFRLSAGKWLPTVNTPGAAAPKPGRESRPDPVRNAYAELPFGNPSPLRPLTGSGIVRLPEFSRRSLTIE
jgi:hypothetical protein